MNENNFEAKIIVIGTLLIFGLLTFVASLVIVPAGSVKVVKRLGRVTNRVLRPGASFIIPFMEGTITYNTKLITYETAIEKNQEGSKADYSDYPVDTNTSDGQPVDIAYTIRFSVDPKRAAWVAQNIGNEDDLVEKIVKTESRIESRNIPRRYDAEVLYTGEGSEKAQNEIGGKLRPVFKEKGLTLDRVGIREIYFPDKFVKKVEERQNAAIEVETAKEIAEKAEYEKEARITKAEGEAEEQRLQQQTLTDKLLRKMWIEAWLEGGSQVPNVMTGNGENLLFNVPQE